MKHGHTKKGSKTKEYEAWSGMLRRCRDRSGKNYRWYGANGVSVCAEWECRRTGFQAFLRDMGESPSAGHSLDRIDATGNYEKSNCRWATVQQQARNKRNSIFIDGVPILDWCAAKGLPYRRVLDRYRRGDRGTLLERDPTPTRRWPHCNQPPAADARLSTQEAAAYLGVSEGALRGMRRYPTGPAYVRVSKHRFEYERSVLDAWRAQRYRSGVVLRTEEGR